MNSRRMRNGLSIGEMLRLARESNGWSRDELSRKTKPRISESTIKRLEGNEDANPTLDTILTLAKAIGEKFYHLSVMELLRMDLIPQYRTELAPTRAYMFRVSPKNVDHIPRYPIIDDPEEHALKVVTPLNVEFIQPGWTIYLSPNAPIHDGDLALYPHDSGGCHIERDFFDSRIKMASPELQERMIAERQRNPPEKIVMIAMS